MNFNFNELLNLVNILIIPLFYYIIKLENRLTHLESELKIYIRILERILDKDFRGKDKL